MRGLFLVTYSQQLFSLAAVSKANALVPQWHKRLFGTPRFSSAKHHVSPCRCTCSKQTTAHLRKAAHQVCGTWRPHVRSSDPQICCGVWTPHLPKHHGLLSFDSQVFLFLHRPLAPWIQSFSSLFTSALVACPLWVQHVLEPGRCPSW